MWQDRLQEGFRYFGHYARCRRNINASRLPSRSPAPPRSGFVQCKSERQELRVGSCSNARLFKDNGSGHSVFEFAFFFLVKVLEMLAHYLMQDRARRVSWLVDRRAAGTLRVRLG